MKKNVFRQPKLIKKLTVGRHSMYQCKSQKYIMFMFCIWVSKVKIKIRIFLNLLSKPMSISVQ